MAQGRNFTLSCYVEVVSVENIDALDDTMAVRIRESPTSAGIACLTNPISLGSIGTSVPDTQSSVGFVDTTVKRNGEFARISGCWIAEAVLDRLGAFEVLSLLNRGHCNYR